MNEDILYELVESSYFDSRDFNGLSVKTLEKLVDIETDALREIIEIAITNEVIEARFHDNTHIRAFTNHPNKVKQIEYLKTEEYPGHICLYPHPEKLAVSDKIEKYKDSPYELELAKGYGQLDFRTFDLSVLEYYRNDPRYSYRTDYIHGEIHVKDSHYESGTIPKHDQVFLQTFGFAFDDDLNRYVAVFFCFFADLSPEHQNVWLAKEVKGNIKLHPDYFASSIQGSWGTRMSIFEAFVQELEVINMMCEIAGKPILFRHSYVNDRPSEFGFLLRPTESEFNNFMLLLDKMMSDNINKKFFDGDIELETEKERKDGKIIVSQKGTIQLLEEWINHFFRPSDEKPVNDIFATFRKVRRLRQKPAHKIDENSFDQEIIKKQREIILSAYSALRMLRLIFANHPLVQTNPPEIGEQLLKGEIWHI